MSRCKKIAMNVNIQRRAFLASSLVALSRLPRRGLHKYWLSQFSVSVARERAAPIARQEGGGKKEQIGLLGHRSCMFANPRCTQLVVKVKTYVEMRDYKNR